MPEFLDLQNIGVVIGVGVLVLLCIAIFTKPIRFVFRLLLNTLFGFLMLFLINYAGAFLGIHLGLNWFNAAIVGIFGLPGVGFLLLLQWLLLI